VPPENIQYHHAAVAAADHIASKQTRRMEERERERERKIIPHTLSRLLLLFYTKNG
jgi:hypothetical protein